MNEQITMLKNLKSVYLTKIRMIDVDLKDNMPSERQKSLVKEQTIYRSFVSELSEILNS